VGLTVLSYFSSRWGERHAASQEPEELGGHTMHKIVQLPLEVTALDVEMPLVLPLDGDVAILAIATAVELTP
jgi:hypothetical protein